VLKPFLGDAYRDIAARLSAAIAIRYNLPLWTEKERRPHKKADRVAAASEAVHVVGWTDAEVRNVLRIPFKPLAEDPLAPVYGDTPWEPWPPRVATERFLAELKGLTARAAAADRQLAKPRSSVA